MMLTDTVLGRLRSVPIATPQSGPDTGVYLVAVVAGLFAVLTAQAFAVGSPLLPEALRPGDCRYSSRGRSNPVSHPGKVMQPQAYAVLVAIGRAAPFLLAPRK